MKPTWEKLAAEYNDSADKLVADVDCTDDANRALCSEHGVQGFPTLKLFPAGETEGEDYEGGRDLAELREFAQTLGPGCSSSNKDACTAEQLAELEKLLATPAAELEAELVQLKESITAAETAHDELVKGLQQQYEESEKKTDEIKKSAKPRMKAIRAALGGGAPASSAAKDEV